MFKMSKASPKYPLHIPGNWVCLLRAASSTATRMDSCRLTFDSSLVHLFPSQSWKWNVCAMTPCWLLEHFASIRRDQAQIAWLTVIQCNDPSTLSSVSGHSSSVLLPPAMRKSLPCEVSFRLLIGPSFFLVFTEKKTKEENCILIILPMEKNYYTVVCYSQEKPRFIFWNPVT